MFFQVKLRFFFTTDCCKTHNIGNMAYNICTLELISVSKLNFPFNIRLMTAALAAGSEEEEEGAEHQAPSLPTRRAASPNGMPGEEAVLEAWRGLKEIRLRNLFAHISKNQSDICTYIQ